MNDLVNCLPLEAKKKFIDIEDGTVLGASNHIRMIAEMFVTISDEIEDKAEASNLIKKVSEHFKNTRGLSSYAIVNALNKIEHYCEESDEKIYSEKIKNGVKHYFDEAVEISKKITEYSVNLLEDCKTIIAFDYSSTVEKTLRELRHEVTVIIPESRVINGGYNFVKPCLDRGHKVRFIPDASMLTVLRTVDAVIIGAETFYPDGTAFNTAGSDILAVLCKEYNIPYYVLTPMLKVDNRALYGKFKKEIIRDEKDTLAKNWPTELAEKVDFKVIELVPIKPDKITKYVTEHGIVSPCNLNYYLCKEGV